MMDTYSGVGSRETPNGVCTLMTETASYLAKRGYTLRSGAADGADKAFETGCDQAGGVKEIYLPWKGFNGSTSRMYHVGGEALDLAAEYHPCFDKLGKAAKLLMARNGYQVLGSDLKSPVKFVVCWTLGARLTGEAAQAIRIALDRKIPVINLADPEKWLLVQQWLTLKLDFLEPICYDLFGGTV